MNNIFGYYLQIFGAFIRKISHAKNRMKNIIERKNVFRAYICCLLYQADYDYVAYSRATLISMKSGN